MIDLGDVHPLTIDITDADGAAADAGTVTLTVTLPDGTTETPTVSNPTTGRYQCDFATTQAGRHTARWVATGANAGSYVEVFDVREALPGFIVGLADTKAHLNIAADKTMFDEELRAFIEAATPVVEDVVGPVVVRTYTEVHNGGPVLVLDHCPVVSLTSITAVLTGGSSYETTDVDTDQDTGVVRRLDGAAFTGPLRVAYRAGRAVIPPNITQGAKEIVRHMWDTQRGHAGTRPGLGEEEFVTTGSGFTIPRRVMELLAPQRKAPVVA